MPPIPRPGPAWTVSLADLGVETVFAAGQRAGVFAPRGTTGSAAGGPSPLAPVRPAGLRSATVGG